MSEKEISFEGTHFEAEKHKEVKKDKTLETLKFWTLEQRREEEVTEEEAEEYKARAWVFQKERDAIMKLKDLMAEEEIDPSNLDSIERMSRKYNLQEVEIAEKKYNMRAVSWLKVFLLSSAQK